MDHYFYRFPCRHCTCSWMRPHLGTGVLGRISNTSQLLQTALVDAASQAERELEQAVHSTPPCMATNCKCALQRGLSPHIVMKKNAPPHRCTGHEDMSACCLMLVCVCMDSLTYPALQSGAGGSLDHVRRVHAHVETQHQCYAHSLHLWEETRDKIIHKSQTGIRIYKSEGLILHKVVKMRRRLRNRPTSQQAINPDRDHSGRKWHPLNLDLCGRSQQTQTWPGSMTQGSSSEPSLCRSSLSAPQHHFSFSVWPTWVSDWDDTGQNT